MFKKRSKTLFIGTALATIYIIYLINYFGGIMGDLNSADELGGAIAATLVTPHIIAITLGTIFSWIGFFLRKSWAALVGAILYCLGALLFMMYMPFCIPIIILGFIGYAKQKKYDK